MQTFIHIFIPNFKFMKFIYFSHSSPPPPRPRMGRQKARTFHNKQQYFWRSFAGDEAEFSGTLSYCLKNESVEELWEKLASNCYCWVIPPESGEELLVNHVPKGGWLCKQSWWIRGDYKATIVIAALRSFRTIPSRGVRVKEWEERSEVTVERLIICISSTHIQHNYWA